MSFTRQKIGFDSLHENLTINISIKGLHEQLMTKRIYGRVFKKRFKKAKLTRCMHSMHLTKLNLNPLFQYLSSISRIIHKTQNISQTLHAHLTYFKCMNDIT